MRRAITLLAWAGAIVLMAGGGSAGPLPGTAAVAPPPTGTPPCPDPMAVIGAFYDSNDASQYDASLAFLTPGATLSSWAEGVNGRHWQEKHLTGSEQIRPVLGNRGLRRASGQPGAPILRETEAEVSGDRVVFMLRPDRLSPDGRPSNSYRVEAVFLGCKIKSLTVIEYISWE